MSTVTVSDCLIVISQLLSRVFSQLRIHLSVKTIYILLSDSCYHISFTMSVSKKRRAAAIAAYIIMQRKSRRPKRKHSCWVREWILKREEYGAYHALKNELKISDPCQLRNFLRMSAIDFDNLTNRLGHKLFRRDTSMRAAISVKEKLAVTLRYLASGKQNMT